MHANTISGFVPNTTQADPNWGKCLQCGALDRARYHSTPPVQRSSFCSQCFQQYCYDPQNPPSQDELPGRKFQFVDPDPQGPAAAESFVQREKIPIIAGSIGAAVVIVALIIFG